MWHLSHIQRSTATKRLLVCDNQLINWTCMSVARCQETGRDRYFFEKTISPILLKDQDEKRIKINLHDAPYWTVDHPQLLARSMPQTTAKMVWNHNTRLRSSSLYMFLGQWVVILSLSFLKLTKMDFRRLSSVDLDLHDGYNWIEKWRRQMIKWEIAHIGRLDRLLWYKHGAVVRQWYWVRT